MNIPTDPIFKLDQPVNHDTSLIFASPHSGREYGRVVSGQLLLDDRAIRSSEDAFVDRIYASSARNGAPFLQALIPRAYLDLNRAADEFDPALIAGAPRPAHNPRINSGLGVIPRVVAGGRPIYSGKLTLLEANRRIGNWWRPYHDRLQRLLDQSLFAFGEAILIDCHSMPHEAIGAAHRNDASLPQVVLGDRFGASASHYVTENIEAAFANAGFRVARNTPFAGAYIAQHYGRPGRNQHVVQIELDRSLYMHEATLTPHDDFDDFCARMAGVVAEISDIGRKPRRLAAE